MEPLLLDLICNAAAALRTSVDSSPELTLWQTASREYFHSLATCITSQFCKARLQAVREFWELMLLNAHAGVTLPPL